MTRLAFHKMHGLGNDFVVLDQRRDPYPIDAAAARAVADRRTGIGCDRVSGTKRSTQSEMRWLSLIIGAIAVRCAPFDSRRQTRAVSAPNEMCD